MNPSDLLERMAAMFKAEIGPAVDGEYPRTQAYLSAVVLQKLAGQLRCAEAHSAAERENLAALHGDIAQMLADMAAPPSLLEACAGLKDGDGGLSAFIQALYALREEIGEDRFESLLARVRRSMRASIDRRMEYVA